MHLKAGARLLQGRKAAGAALHGWPSVLSLAAHGAAIALAVWLATMLRSAPPVASPAGVPVVFRPAPSMAPLPGVPAPPQPLAAVALSAAPSVPRLPAMAATAPPLPPPPDTLAASALPPPARWQEIPKPIRQPAKTATHNSPAVPRPGPSAPMAPPAPAAVPSAAALPAPLLPPHPVSAGAGNAPPAYPESARRRGHQGRVVLRVAVSATGRPLAVTVAHSSGFKVLDMAAADAVRQWHFLPASRGGVPRPGVAEVPVRFELEN